MGGVLAVRLVIEFASALIAYLTVSAAALVRVVP
jgi:hypothetical protein